jgi:putative nucleotidyltransferase with HDIG domain
MNAPRRPTKDSRWAKEPTGVVEVNEADVDPTGAKRQQVQDVAKAVLRRVLDGKFRIPMLPGPAMQAMQVANDPAASVRDVEAVLRADALVTARVVAVANSPLYGSGTTIRSLSQAMMRLGLGTVRDLIYQAVAEAHIFRGPDERALQAEREHAASVAYSAKLVCRAVGIDPEYAFLCGLLHDVGRTVMLDVLSREPPPGLAPAAYPKVADLVHAAVGERLAQAWKLPALVAESARRHHKYRDYDGEGAYSQMGHVIAAADRLALHHGHGRRAWPIDPDKGEAVFFELGLEPSRLSELIAAADAAGSAKAA